MSAKESKSGRAKTPKASAVERLLNKEHWIAARALILKQLKDEPDNHWLLTRLGTAYYEQRKYKKALEYTLEAFALQPRCPLVLWDYAGALEMLGRTEESLGLYQQLLGRDFEALAHGECGEGYDWALQLLNDCHYRMGRCCAFLGDKRSAQLSYLKYLHNRSHGVGSIYELSQVEHALAEVSNGAKPRGSDKHDTEQALL